MKKLFISIEKFIEKQGLSLFLTLLTGAIIVTITIVSWFWSAVYQIISDTHAFEAIVLITLIELVVLLTKENRGTDEFQVFKDESDAHAKIFEVSRQEKIKKAIFVSAGLGSRRFLIGTLVKSGIKVEVLAQDPETAIDTNDSQRAHESIDWIRHDDIVKEKLSNLDLWFHANIASLRAVILFETDSNIKHLFLGWYTYDSNSRIYGSQNPTIYVSTRSHRGQALGEWIERMVEKDKREGCEVPSEF